MQWVLLLAAAIVCVVAQTPIEVLNTEFVVTRPDGCRDDSRLIEYHRFDAALTVMFLPERHLEIRANAVSHFCTGQSLSFYNSDLNPAWRYDSVKMWWMSPDEDFSDEFYKACSAISAAFVLPLKLGVWRGYSQDQRVHFDATAELLRIQDELMKKEQLYQAECISALESIAANPPSQL